MITKTGKNSRRSASLSLMKRMRKSQQIQTLIQNSTILIQNSIQTQIQTRSQTRKDLETRIEIRIRTIATTVNNLIT